MFKKLCNQARVHFILSTDAPLIIKSSDDSAVNPSIPDMSVVRTYRNGSPTVYMPGSSIKGVIRSRIEGLLSGMEYNICSLEKGRSCADTIDGKKIVTGEQRYKASCIACQMFGSLALAGRFQFKDALPVVDVDHVLHTGVRNGVAINRITGGAQSGALYNYEVIEQGSFAVSITMENFELYQLKLLLWCLQDINDGYVAFGMGTTRGNGRMIIEESAFAISLLDYRPDVPSAIRGYHLNDTAGSLAYVRTGFANKAQISHLDEALTLLQDIGLPARERV